VSIKHLRLRALALVLSLATTSAIVGSASALAMPSEDYRFDLFGGPLQAGGMGKMHQADSWSIVRVRLTKGPAGEPVSDAAFTEIRADMTPAGMPQMMARTRELWPEGHGVYRFEVHPLMAGSWTLHLTAKVSGEPDPVRGDVIVALAK
jgi:hypothetical protein